MDLNENIEEASTPSSGTSHLEENANIAQVNTVDLDQLYNGLLECSQDYGLKIDKMELNPSHHMNQRKLRKQTSRWKRQVRTSRDKSQHAASHPIRQRPLFGDTKKESFDATSKKARIGKGGISYLLHIFRSTKAIF